MFKHPLPWTLLSVDLPPPPLPSPPDSPLLYYFILRGVDRFFTEFNTLPGMLEDHVEPDIGRLKGSVAKVLAEYGLPAGQVRRDKTGEQSIEDNLDWVSTPNS